jgi:hypothetical protein
MLEAQSGQGRAPRSGTLRDTLTPVVNRRDRYPEYQQSGTGFWQDCAALPDPS